MAFPIIPLIAAGLLLGACAAAVKQDKSTKPLNSLIGTEWGFHDSSDRFVNFGQDGQFTGSGGCNNFFGAYELDGTRLTIGTIASTKKFCPDQAQAEQSFIDALQKSRRFEATHTQLALFTSDGDKVLDLARRDFD